MRFSEPHEFKIEAGMIGTDTKVYLEDKLVKGLFSYNLQGAVDEITQLDLNFSVIKESKIKGKGIVEFSFSLPEDKRARRALYEQLKTEFGVDKNEG